MRVIVSCVPQTGHILPLLPLAQAFAGRGDDVIIASGPDAEETVTNRGLSFRAVGPSFGSWFAALRAERGEYRVTGWLRRRVGGYFGPPPFWRRPGWRSWSMTCSSFARCQSRAVLVFDPYLFAGPLVAEATGALAVLHSKSAVDRIGASLTSWATPYVRSGASSALRSHRPRGIFGDHLRICPPSLDPAIAGLRGPRPCARLPCRWRSLRRCRFHYPTRNIRWST